jgi:hypothetical protein
MDLSTSIRGGAATQLGPNYGVDFTYSRIVDGVPVRWDPASPVVLRMVSPISDEAFVGAVRCVADIVEITGMALEIGDPIDGPVTQCVSTAEVLRAPGEIRVAWVDPAFFPPDRSENTLGLGAAIPDSSGLRYTAGWAVVRADLAADDPVRALACLRHELTHALGMAHANRASCLMHASAGAQTWSAGEREGLRRLCAGQPIGRPNRAVAFTVTPAHPSYACGSKD